MVLKLNGVIESLNNGFLTELEASLMDYILDDYVNYDGMPSEFMYTAQELNISYNQLKGIVGSLVKKELVWTEDYTSGEITDQWIHATEKGLSIVGLKYEDLG